MTSQTRRGVLLNTAKGALGIITAAAVGPLLLEGCKKNDGAQKVDIKDGGSKDDDANVASCPNQENLSQQDQQIRGSLNYVDKTPMQGRTCDNCKLYTLPQPGVMCGGCKVVPGPIHPKGYCTAWIHRM